MSMLRNYVTVALRNLLRHKVYSAINILGLAVGLASCIVIMLWVRFHLSFDNFHTNADRIYLLYEKVNFSGTSDQEGNATMGPMGPTLKNDYPGIENYTRVYDIYGFNTRVRENPILLKSVFMADSTVFEMFSFKFLMGNPGTALVDPYSIVLTRESARTLFGDENPLGQVVRSNDYDYKVTGVVEDIPRNSVFRFNMLVSISTLENYKYLKMPGWGNNCLTTYLMLRNGVDYRVLEKQFPEFMNKYVPDVAANIKLCLHPLRGLSQRFNFLSSGPSWTYIYVFSAIAVIVLLVACINFINLSLARSTGRAREVGLRKTVGAERGQLIFQFLSESVFLAFCALFLGIAILELILPGLNVFFGDILVFDYIRNWRLSLGLIGIALLAGLFAGLYPAFILSSFHPIAVLKGQITSGLKGRFLRRFLVIAQFAASIILITFTLFASRQLNYLRNSELGFIKDQVVILPLGRDMRNSLNNIREELLQNPSITGVAASSNTFGNVYMSLGIHFEGMDPKEEDKWSVSSIFADENFIPFYGLSLVAGRNFSSDFSTDSSVSYVINEELARRIGWTPENAIGKKFSMWRGSEGMVIGVVKDFNYNSMHSRINPLALRMYPDMMNFASVRIRPEKATDALKYLEKKWNGYMPDQPFEYSFLDEDFARLYQADRQAALLVGGFSALAVFIACLGLLGLISYAAQRRTKEIGIRKVLGASVQNIILLLSREFLVLLGVSILIAWPVAWYLTNRWLESFAYRIDLGWATFLLGGAIALVIASLTVSYQAVKAATANPVESLRYE